MSFRDLRNAFHVPSAMPEEWQNPRQPHYIYNACNFFSLKIFLNDSNMHLLRIISKLLYFVNIFLFIFLYCSKLKLIGLHLCFFNYSTSWGSNVWGHVLTAVIEMQFIHTIVTAFSGQLIFFSLLPGRQKTWSQVSFTHFSLCVSSVCIPKLLMVALKITQRKRRQKNV